MTFSFFFKMNQLPITFNPILPVSSVSKTDIADNFDESTVINDNLNMHGYYIYNLKNPTNDQDASTKIYVDLKTYNINSANITGNLPWSRISNIPEFFPSRISTTTIDADINLGSYKIIKNGNEIIGLSDDSVITSYIADNAVTNDKILSLDYSKLTNIPPLVESDNKVSTLDVDADLIMNNKKITSNALITENNQLVTKSYIDSLIGSTYPPFSSSMASFFSCYENSSLSGIQLRDVNRVHYWISTAGNISSASYSNTNSNNSRPYFVNETLGNSLNFTGSQGMFTKYLNVSWNAGNLYITTCFILLKYNIPNSSATTRQTGISFDGGAYGRCFQAVDDRNGSTTSNSTFGPALFVGTSFGNVQRFKNNNGTGTPIQLAADTWYLIMFSYTPSDQGFYFVANAYVDGQQVINNHSCENQTDVNYGSIGCQNNSSGNTFNTGFNGRIAEVVFYSRGLKDLERIQVETYFKNKWNLPFSYTG